MNERRYISPEKEDVEADRVVSSGVRGTAARFPYWATAIGFVIFALVALYPGWIAWPTA